MLAGPTEGLQTCDQTSGQTGASGELRGRAQGGVRQVASKSAKESLSSGQEVVLHLRRDDTTATKGTRVPSVL